MHIPIGAKEIEVPPLDLPISNLPLDELNVPFPAVELPPPRPPKVTPSPLQHPLVRVASIGPDWLADMRVRPFCGPTASWSVNIDFLFSLPFIDRKAFRLEMK